MAGISVFFSDLWLSTFFALGDFGDLHSTVEEGEQQGTCRRLRGTRGGTCNWAWGDTQRYWPPTKLTWHQPPPPLDAPGQRHGQQPISGTADPRSSQTGQVIQGLR